MTSTAEIWEDEEPHLTLVPELVEDERLTDYERSLVEDHLYLIPGAVKWAHRRRSGPLDHEQAEADAALGLCQAAKRFNPTFQVQFPSFAVYAARGAIIDGERRRHKLGGPDRKQAREPSLFNSSGTRSLDEPLKPGISFTLLDVLPSDIEPTDKSAIDRTVEGGFYAGLPLTPRQKAVYFLKARKYTLKEIAAQLAVSERTVSRDFKGVVRILFDTYQPDMFQ